MPVTFEQMGRMKKADPEQYDRTRKDLIAFSRALYQAAQKLDRGNKTDAKIGKKLRDYSDAVQHLTLNPFDSGNRARIDEALDKLATFGDFLGRRAEEYSGSNVCEHIILNSDINEGDRMKKGLHLVNKFCDFGLYVNGLMEGTVNNPTQQDRLKQQQELKAWHEQRERERKQTEQKEREAADALAKKQQEAARRREEQRLAEEREAQEREKERKAEEERQRRLAKEERRRREEEQRTEQERLEAEARERQQQIERQNGLRTSIESLLAQARNPQTPADQKLASMSEAVAYQRELNYVEPDGSEPIDMNRVNRNAEAVYDSAAFAIAQRQGKLDELAAMSVDALNQHILRTEQEINIYAEGGADAPSRAGHIFRQMNHTWRFGGSSRQFDDAKQAMQELSNKERVTQVDNYFAAETVKTYVAKNITEAKSDVGKTRMACSLAFLKQTMSKASFEAYCNSLNALRRIPSTAGVFDVNHPRCIVPDEIGTIKEVYKTAKERFHNYANAGYQKPSARDLAMMTALRNLQAKAGGDENLVVQHEALMAEITKVQADRRFQDALNNRTAHELIEMGFGGNIDTINGYTQPLRPEQQERIQAELDHQSQIKAEEEARKEAERLAKIEEDRLAKEKADREEAERIKAEQERIQKENERAEFLKNHKTLSNLYEELLPDVQNLGTPNVEGVFDILQDEKPYQRDMLELVANMVALGEIQNNNYLKNEEKEADPWVNLNELKDRVNTLKKDRIVKEIAKNFANDPNIRKVVSSYTKEGQEQLEYNKKEKAIYPAVKMASKMYNSYAKELATQKAMAEPKTVAEIYKSLKKGVDMILNRSISAQQATKIVAMSVALQEIEKKDGINGVTNFNTIKARVNKLATDPSIKEIGHDLASPFRGKELERAINMTTNREQTVAKELDSMYQQKVAEKQKAEVQEVKEKPPVMGGPLPG